MLVQLRSRRIPYNSGPYFVPPQHIQSPMLINAEVSLAVQRYVIGIVLGLSIYSVEMEPRHHVDRLFKPDSRIRWMQAINSMAKLQRGNCHQH